MPHKAPRVLNFPRYLRAICIPMRPYALHSWTVQ